MLNNYGGSGFENQLKGCFIHGNVHERRNRDKNYWHLKRYGIKSSSPDWDLTRSQNTSVLNSSITVIHPRQTNIKCLMWVSNVLFNSHLIVSLTSARNHLFDGMPNSLLWIMIRGNEHLLGLKLFCRPKYQSFQPCSSSYRPFSISKRIPSMKQLKPSGHSGWWSFVMIASLNLNGAESQFQWQGRKASLDIQCPGYMWLS